MKKGIVQIKDPKFLRLLHRVGPMKPPKRKKNPNARSLTQEQVTELKKHWQERKEGEDG